jgi:hypothetical protein
MGEENNILIEERNGGIAGLANRLSGLTTNYKMRKRKTNGRKYVN